MRLRPAVSEAKPVPAEREGAGAANKVLCDSLVEPSPLLAAAISVVEDECEHATFASNRMTTGEIELLRYKYACGRAAGLLMIATLLVMMPAPGRPGDRGERLRTASTASAIQLVTASS